MVRGDLVVPESDRIMTRSRARQSESLGAWSDEADRPDPDQYTMVPASLKIIKVLIEELLSAAGVQNAAAAASTAAAAAAALDEDNDNDGWEDDETLDLSLGTTKQELMGFENMASGRQRDDETQKYLTEFFIGAARDNTAGFNEWYGMLTDDEKRKLQEAAGA